MPERHMTAQWHPLTTGKHHVRSTTAKNEIPIRSRNVRIDLPFYRSRYSEGPQKCNCRAFARDDANHRFCCCFLFHVLGFGNEELGDQGRLRPLFDVRYPAFSDTQQSYGRGYGGLMALHRR